MSHIIEPASSGRAKCRGCKRTIDKGELRFGERLPNPFAEGDMTLWFHVMCAAYRRPEPLQEALTTSENRDKLADVDDLTSIIEAGLQHPRLCRISGIELAPSARARCRSCKQAIGRNEWRVSLEFFEEGMFNPSGYVHVACGPDYFGTRSLIDRITWFCPDLDREAIDSISQTLESSSCG